MAQNTALLVCLSPLVFQTPGWDRMPCKHLAYRAEISRRTASSPWDLVELGLHCASVSLQVQDPFTLVLLSGCSQPCPLGNLSAPTDNSVNDVGSQSVHCILQTFSQYFWSTYCVPGSVQGTGETVTIKANKVPTLMVLLSESHGLLVTKSLYPTP